MVQSLEKLFQQINRENVKIRKRERKNYKQVMFSVLNIILSKMKECDKLFASLRPRLLYVGSYFEGLRVRHPNEYDINVVLKLPINYDKIILNAKDASSSYTHVVLPSEFRRLIKNTETTSRGFRATELWCDRLHRLNLFKFKSWMQGVLDHALSELPIENNRRKLVTENNKYLLSTTMSGPANTIKIEAKHQRYIMDVDLVPTFAFPTNKIPENTDVQFDKLADMKKLEYYIVPKPFDNDMFGWRLSFPLHEKLLMCNKHHMKSVIKLMKLLRDTQQFHGLASYFIKTLFLHELARQPEDFWTNSLTYLVLFMLNKLKESLASKSLANYWCQDFNLLKNIKSETLENWTNRINYILNDINTNAYKNPTILCKYFSAKNTLKNTDRRER